MGHPFIASPSCSALIKIVDNNVYLSHVTWSTYSIMLRVLKHYNFPWKTVNRTGVLNEIFFTDYYCSCIAPKWPGTVESGDSLLFLSKCSLIATRGLDLNKEY